MYGVLKAYYIVLIYSFFGKYILSFPDIVSDVLVIGFIILSLHHDRYQMYVPRKLGNFCIGVTLIPALVILVYSLIVQIFQSLGGDYIFRSATLCIRWALYCLCGVRTVYVFKAKSADVLLLSCVIAYIPSIFAYFLQSGILSGIAMLFSSEVYNGSSALEVHRLTYVFGFLAVYYLYQWIVASQNTYPQIFLSIAMLMLGVKRIANFALIIALLIIVIFKLINSDGKKFQIMCISSVALVAIALMYVSMIKSGYLQIAFKYLEIEDNFRFNFWNYVSPKYEISPMFIGNGISYAQRFMWNEWSGIDGLTASTNLHNDILGYYIGLGFVGFCLFFAMFFLGQVILLRKWFSTRSALFAFVISVYYFVIMTTSNEGMPGIVYACYMMLIFAMASNECTHLNEKRCINDRITTEGT